MVRAYWPLPLISEGCHSLKTPPTMANGSLGTSAETLEFQIHGDALRPPGILRRPSKSRQRKPTFSSFEPRDLISALPDAVIHHIFSFLPLKDVIKTSVLSKRWRCTWTSTTHLAFNGVRPRNHDASSFDFPSLVDSVPEACTSPTVKKFHVTDLQYHEADRPKVDRWLHFVAGRRVEDLCLSLITEMRSMYILPPSLYCWSWLVRLEVSLCRFSWDLTVSWPCLKVLSMEYAELSDDFLRRILRGSPVLESLELRQSVGA
ncbi:putative F-box/LRR-repeat protein At5g02930 [Eucalyptus grandis]|uniref:putative F-box/LRR-repeat protein At5g02930 n=1 Tax=Eucalyptus grandis TaxID=71139 RepID=UPI00192E7917|nr:putative F-box/LRR-repeat protein At5g02930 [Eucalyptus grandis]